MGARKLYNASTDTIQSTNSINLVGRLNTTSIEVDTVKEIVKEYLEETPIYNYDIHREPSVYAEDDGSLVINLQNPPY